MSTVTKMLYALEFLTFDLFYNEKAIIEINITTNVLLDIA